MRTATRRFFKISLVVILLSLVVLIADAWHEARSLHLTRSSVTLKRLPPAFDGITCALIVDVHHGPSTSLQRVAEMVDRVNAAHPDLVCLCGDYAYSSSAYLEPCIRELGRLRAPLGVYAVLGNHDHWQDAPLTRRCLASAGIPDLTNTNVPITRNGATIWLCGVGDLWTDKQDLSAALAGVPDGACRILLSHNPDYADLLPKDAAFDLILSGHTHGGQVRIPFFGSIITSSRHWHKYDGGLVQVGASQVFVSHGIGTITPPIRLNCPAEVPILTLKSPS